MTKTWYVPTGYKYPQYLEDMATREHVLIGGATGSGKSVALEGFLFSLLVTKAPCEAQFILIDPKRVELAQFKKLPHTLKHAYEISDINETLVWANEIMERRYAKMEEKGLKLYDGSDIYIIIDEYASIGGKHGQASKQAITALSRIAFMGRATKIHIVACTQRPTQDVLDGLIKNNITTTLALRTNTAQESRNLIGIGGCNDLPLYGKAYYKTPTAKGVSLQTINKVPTEYMEEVIKHWEEQR